MSSTALSLESCEYLNLTMGMPMNQFSLVLFMKSVHTIENAKETELFFGNHGHEADASLPASWDV